MTPKQTGYLQAGGLTPVQPSTWRTCTHWLISSFFHFISPSIRPSSIPSVPVNASVSVIISPRWFCRLERVDRYRSGQADEGRESQTLLILPGPTAERRLTASFISRLCHTRKASSSARLFVYTAVAPISSPRSANSFIRDQRS